MGHEIDEASNDRMAVRLMERGGVDLMVAGVDPTDAEALELLAYMRRKHRHVPVILLFPGSYPERTKEALRLGALAVLKYPVPATELRAAGTQALGPLGAPVPAPATAFSNQTTAAAAPAHHAPPPAPRADQIGRDWGIIGTDASLRQAIELAATIAPTRAP